MIITDKDGQSLAVGDRVVIEFIVKDITGKNVPNLRLSLPDGDESFYAAAPGPMNGIELWCGSKLVSKQTGYRYGGML